MCTKLMNQVTTFILSSAVSVVSDSATPSSVAPQAPLSLGFSRQEYWTGFPCPSPEDLPDPGIKPSCSVLQADSSPAGPSGKSIPVVYKIEINAPSLSP